MALQVHKEPDEFAGEPAENCCVCQSPTRYWHASDVALCPSCAETVSRGALPTKAEWMRDDALASLEASNAQSLSGFSPRAGGRE